MEPDWKLIGKNISNYIDNETFLSTRNPTDICNVLDNSKLLPQEFTTLFTNLSKYHGKSDMIMMLGHAHTSELVTQAEVDKISETISSILGISLLDTVFSFTKNKTQEQNSNSQIQNKEELRNFYVYFAKEKQLDFKDISMNTTIEAFKLLLQNKSGVPVKNQLLYKCHKPVPNSGTLK
ncbi:hypothetical protein TVAG_116200 [Trichomonas vaginalis G3]|uniref:Uncharacterized protein n=1 Tax=Trichomonas vaginalis (strain ATCC PRA-98 / G3) TaxID=412133 RepID=A2EXQ6_TRIV3|nr:cellular macromolecule catabolic process [Trichomonas vaginalis G3]EAY02566.1 hypothetical protein TVAG_116200 [Trichomonas vaginalis G3]KAI5552043.1 cellular macromolecule catabolic process [Trichomonas vaginalis G3]|eukprot:XP_001330702.1 hypothetical protein [Trichomonas vaginalis G3]